MSSWIRTDWNFDLPMAVLVIGARQLQILRQTGAVAPHDENDPDAVCAAITDLIEAHRPELKGLVMVSINLQSGAMMWRLTVAHPSLPKTPQYESLPEQHLNPCAACGKPVPWKGGLNGGTPYRLLLHQGEVLLCSEECRERTRLSDAQYMQVCLGLGDSSTEFEKAWGKMITDLGIEQKQLMVSDEVREAVKGMDVTSTAVRELPEGWGNRDLVAAVLDICEEMSNGKNYAPWTLVLDGVLWDRLGDQYLAVSCLTLRQRLLNIEGIFNLEASSNLTGHKLALKFAPSSLIKDDTEQTKEPKRWREFL